MQADSTSMSLPISIPRAIEVRRFFENPLACLTEARSRLGDIFVVRDGEPIFSRASNCSGTIAVFGSAFHRAVLSDIELFGMPISAAEDLSLPAALVNLNRGLHSMRGEQHAQHQRLLMRVLGELCIEHHDTKANAALETFAQGWNSGQTIGILTEMRRLAHHVATRLLLGDQYPESSQLAAVLQAYFHFRREVTSPFNPADKSQRNDLVMLGTVLDDALRRYIRWCRRNARSSLDGVVPALANLKSAAGELLSEDEAVAHSNVLFMSSTEPVAVSLTWILLMLSQVRELRRALRQELAQTTADGAALPWSELARLSLLDSVINESLRLFPANALMVRLTTQPASLQKFQLPKYCEVVLSPFVAHRDGRCFPDPDQFSPPRWKRIKPSPFEYLPFGAGGHACVGRHLAMYLIKKALAWLVPRYELVLADDQEVDWRIQIQFMPRNDPIMRVRIPSASDSRGGKLLGPVADLVSFDASSL
jgi:cytochrome P450